MRDLYGRLRTSSFVPWLDEEDLLPGQRWEDEIPKAVRNSDVVIVCLSRASINKRGYVQKEIKYALDVADEQPEGSIFLIPLRLEDCEVPGSLCSNQWVDYFKPSGYERLLKALRARAQELGFKAATIATDDGNTQASTVTSVRPSGKADSYELNNIVTSNSINRVKDWRKLLRPGTTRAVVISLSVLLLLLSVLASLWPSDRLVSQRAISEKVLNLLNNPSEITPTLYPGATRGDGAVARIKPSGDVDIVRLHLSLIEDKYRSYHAELRTEEGLTLVAVYDLQIATQDSGKVAVIKLPAKILAPGGYRIELSGRTDDGKMQEIAEYYFQFERS